jgi:cellulose synthase operon protein B
VIGSLRLILCAAALAAASCATAMAQADQKQQDEPAAVAPESPPAAPVPTLRRFANNAERFRLAGEIATIEWPVYLTDAEADEIIRFRLGYVAAVSVMPEASALKVTINDTVIATTPILSTQQERVVEFDVPASLLRSGFNAVRISADQRHRVDCSLAATYELWTQIDPASTGLLLPADDRGAASIADLPALPTDEHGALPIRIVLPAHSSRADVERVLRAAQRVALAGRFAQPLVDFGPPAPGAGLNLVIGTEAQLANLLGEATGSAGEPHVQMFAAKPDRRATLVVAGSDGAQLDAALSEIAPMQVPKGSPAGLQAVLASRGYPIEGGQQLQLRDMGVASQEFGGRLFRAAFSIDLPTDFYAADYGKAILDLAGGYSPGLKREAEIAVSVNGRETTTLSLPKASGEVYEHIELPLPLGSLKPGLNRIEIAAELPTPEDDACAARVSVAPPPRFLLLDSSSLTLPRIARVARSPDLGATAMGALPLIGAKKRPALVVPAPEKSALGAAATLVAQLAIASGRVTDYRLTAAPPPPGDGSALVVGAVADLDPKLLRSIGLPKDTIDAAWGDVAAPTPEDSQDATTAPATRPLAGSALRRDRPLSCRGAPGVRTFARTGLGVDRTPVEVAPAVGRGAEPSLAEQWNERMNGSLADAARDRVNDALDWVASRYAVAADVYSRRFGTSQVPAVLTRRSSLAIAQANVDGSPDGVLTLVTAPNAGALWDAVACLVDPGVWRNLAGRVATLDTTDGSMRSLAADRSAFIATSPLSIANVRLIAAGWFSLNADFYVGFALALVLALACSTMWFIRNVGRRAE